MELHTKLILIFATVTTLSLYGLYKQSRPLNAKPENVVDCEAANNYPWKRLDFSVDKDIKPKELVTLMAKFLP